MSDILITVEHNYQQSPSKKTITAKSPNSFCHYIMPEHRTPPSQLGAHKLRDTARFDTGDSLFEGLAILLE